MSRKVTYPHMGEYAIAFRGLAELLGAEVVEPPGITRATLESGSRHSPEFVCLPFKYNLGNFIEALERGANVIVQAGGGCRFGYYAEVQEQILRDLGYEFEFVTLTGDWTVAGYATSLKRIQPSSTYATLLRAFGVAWARAKAIEAVEDFVRKNVGFETERGAMRRIVARMLRDLSAAMSRRDVSVVRDRALEELAHVELDKPKRPLRVGVVGELYVVMEPHSNHHIERRLAEQGVEVHRFVTLTGLIEHGIKGRRHVRRMVDLASPWLNYHVGADGTESVALTWRMLQEGFDGVVHLKPFGCMPEVSAMSALQRIAREHGFPVLFASYDSQTAETGIVTRVEAYCDMLRARKEGRLGA